MPNKPNLRLPEPILDATPEEIAQRTLNLPTKKVWRYEQEHKECQKQRGGFTRNRSEA